MSLSPRNKLIALAVVLLLIVVVLIVVLVLPQFGKLGELDAQIKQANEESTAAQTLLEQRREVKNQAAVTSNTLLQLANAVPENPELPSLIIELQDAAYSSDVSLRSVAPLPPVKDEGKSFVTVPLALTVWGTWADTVDFLQRLRKLGREVRVRTFDTVLLDDAIARENNLKTPPYYRVSTDITVQTYVIPAGTASASETVPPPPPAQ